jgi:hypothetical protein
MAIVSAEGEVWDDAKAQEAIRETIRRCGRFVMGAAERPAIGMIEEFAGLPLKVTGYVTPEEAHYDEDLCQDIWHYGRSDDPFYFVVEVAD